MSQFSGFGKQTTDFLEALGKNNEKPWFDAHRAEYEEFYLEPAKAFVEAVAAPLRAISPTSQAQPRVNGSIFRVNRDIRFSKDKTPYRDHIDMWFWDGEARNRAVSGFYLRIAAKEVIVGAGAHMFDSSNLKRFRSAVSGGSRGAGLVNAVAAARTAGYSIGGEHYKRLPRGFEDADGPTADLLRHNALFVDASVITPKELRSEAFVDYCVGHWEKMAPVHRWLVDHLQEA